MKFSALIMVMAFTISGVSATEGVNKAGNEGVIVTSGFGTGNSYKQMRPAEKAAYASGIIDGLLCAPLHGAPRKEMEWLEVFTKGKTNIQVAAILTKYLDAHPEDWDQPLNLLAHEAFRSAAKNSAARWKD